MHQCYADYFGNRMEYPASLNLIVYCTMECFVRNYLDHIVRFRSRGGAPTKDQIFLDSRGFPDNFAKYMFTSPTWNPGCQRFKFCIATVLLINGIDTYLSWSQFQPNSFIHDQRFSDLISDIHFATIHKFFFTNFTKVYDSILGCYAECSICTTHIQIDVFVSCCFRYHRSKQWRIQDFREEDWVGMVLTCYLV